MRHFGSSTGRTSRCFASTPISLDHFFSWAMMRSKSLRKVTFVVIGNFGSRHDSNAEASDEPEYRIGLGQSQFLVRVGQCGSELACTECAANLASWVTGLSEDMGKQFISRTAMANLFRQMQRAHFYCMRVHSGTTGSGSILHLGKYTCNN